MNGFAGVILGEGGDTTSGGLGPLLGKETLGPVTGSLKLSVRHF